MTDSKPKSKPTDSGKESPKKQPWYGRIKSGIFYCECNKKAILPTVKRASHNKGRKFWTCPKSEKVRCRTFIWLDEEEEAREYLLSLPAPEEEEPPKTPSKQQKEKGKNLETPFTKAKRKPVSREVSDENGESSKAGEKEGKEDGKERGKEGGNDDEDWELMDSETPSRKVAKRARFSTPSGEDKRPGTEAGGDKAKGKDEGKEREKEAATMTDLGLPTPNSDIPNPLFRRATSTSPTPIKTNNKPQNTLLDPIVLDGEEDTVEPRSPDLATSVLRLLRSEGVEIKGSMELQLRHEIELETETNAARIRTYKGTIRKLSKRVDELERGLGLLTGDLSD